MTGACAACGFEHHTHGRCLAAPREVRVVDPVTGGQKGSKLERYDLMPWDSLDTVARTYGRGAEKYPARNWEKGYAWSLSAAALGRHYSAFMRGEWFDPESGLPHLAHAAWHCLTLLAFKSRGLGTNDIPGNDNT